MAGAVGISDIITTTTRPDYLTSEALAEYKCQLQTICKKKFTLATTAGNQSHDHIT